MKMNASKAEIIEKMYESGDTTKKISDVIGLSVRTVQFYIRDHVSEIIGDPWEPFTPASRAKKKDVERRRIEILKIIDEDCTLTQQQIIDKLPENLKCTRKTISVDLKILGLSRKMIRKSPEERNSVATIRTRKTYCTWIHRISDSRVFFLDETGFNLHTGPLYGYSPIGEPATTVVRGNRGANNSVLACIGVTGVIHWESKIGAYNRESYIEFLEELLPLLPHDSIVVMDNAAFHRGEDVSLVFGRYNQEFRFQPPWSPQLNPIEQFWASLKATQRALRPRPRDQDHLSRSITTSMAKIMTRTNAGFYRDMRRYVAKGMRSEDF